MHSRWILAAGLAAVTPRALAQETPAEAARRELITQAEGASDAGDHARALALATRAAQTRMTPSLRLLLAQEQHALGRTLEALDAAERCAREARAGPSLRNRERILASCDELAATLDHRVGRLTVTLATPGARVTVAGRALDAALLGAAYPVLPGRVSVVAEAEGYAAFRRELEVAAGAQETVVVTLARAAARPDASATPAPPAASRSRGAGPWVLAGAGALSLGAGVLFWRFQEDAVAARDAAPSRPDAEGHDGRARAWNLATNIAYGVGAAAVVGGVVWWLVARPPRDDRRTAWSVGAAPVTGGVVVSAGGRM